MPDDGPITRDAAKEHARRFLEDPKHKKPKGSPEDDSTITDALDDPALNVEGDEDG